MKETIGTKLLPFLEKAIDFFTMLIDKFSKLNPTTQNFVIGLTGIVAIGGPLLTFLANAKTAIVTLTGIQGAATVATNLQTGALAGQTVATGAATVATNKLKIALASTGIGLLIVAIGTLIANFDKVKETVSKLITYLSNAFEPVKKAIESVIGRIKDLIPDWLKKLLGIDGATITVNAPNIVGGSGVNSGLNTVPKSGLPFGGNIKKGSKATTIDPFVIPAITESGKAIKASSNALDEHFASLQKEVRTTASILGEVNSFRQKEAADEAAMNRTTASIQALAASIREKESRGDTYNINLNTLQPTADAGKAIVQSIKEFTDRGGNFDRVSSQAV